MHDIRFIREHPEAFDAALKRRGEKPHSTIILKKDEERRKALRLIEAAKAKKNELSKKIGEAKAKGKDISKLLKQVTEAVSEGTIELEKKRAKELHDILSSLPNLPLDDVPDGQSEADNPVLRKEGNKPSFNFGAKEHFDLGEALGGMDFEMAAKVSGARFVVLKGALARLERALGQFMLDHAVKEAGYQEISSPSLAREEAVFGSGQLPKFAADLFRTGQGLWLIPTAEVTLANLRREEIVAEEELPLRFAALTPCYRAEAGAAGKDTRGLIRVHEFQKVELVSITTPEDSLKELERKTKAAEAVLKALGLPYRVVELCTGELGFAARKTYDIEVWLPGQKRYREISSVSDCGDFQARRMNMRCRKKGEKETRFPHTLNGSGVAVGRCLVAVMENYQQPDGSITIPEALHPYLGGLKKIEKP